MYTSQVFSVLALLVASGLAAPATADVAAPVKAAAPAVKAGAPAVKAGKQTKPGAKPAVVAGGGIHLPAGFKKIVFQDNFATAKAGSLPDPAKWQIDLGTQYPDGAANWGTQEIQSYTNKPANLVIKNNALVITPVKDAANKWTSARIETKAGHDVDCPAGGKLRIEAAIRIPNTDPTTQLGIWPAFWMLGGTFRTNRTSWPAVGEIDILEVSNGVNTVFHTSHCGIINGGPCNEKEGKGGSGPFTRGKFTKFAVDIDRTNKDGNFMNEKLIFSVDGKTSFVLNGKDIKDAKAWEALARTPKMILLNVAIGGEFPDAKAKIKTPTPKTVGGAPSAMEIKYVAAFST